MSHSSGKAFESTQDHSLAGAQESKPRQIMSPLNKTVSFLIEIQSRLFSADSVAGLFETTGQLLAQIPGTVEAWIYQRDEHGQLLLVHSWRAPHLAASMHSEQDFGSSIHQRWIAAHGRESLPRTFAYPFVLPGFPNRVVAPIVLDDEFMGAVAVERRDGEIFPYAPDDLSAIVTITGLTAQCLQALALRQRLAEAEQPQRIRQLADQERRRLAHELHDGILQDLAYVMLRLDMLERLAEQDPEQAKSSAHELKEHVDQSIVSVRKTIGHLRRPERATRGLTGQLRELADRMSDRESSVQVDFTELSGTRLTPEIERAVIGIIREALQNIRKHALASTVRIEIQREGGELHVVVTDDGVGFPRDAANIATGHFGLEQMRELSEDMGGTLMVESEPGNGTRVHARIPLVLTKQNQ